MLRLSLSLPKPSATCEDVYLGKVPKALRTASDRYGDFVDPTKTTTG
jgi:hypothetical protein